MKKLLVLLLALLLVLVGCSESEISKVEPKAEEQTKVEEPVTDTVAEPEPESEPVQSSLFKIGDTVNVNGLEVTLKSAKLYEGDNDWEKPENDYFIVLDISIKNTTDEPAHISSLMQMNLYDEEGYSQDMSIFVSTKGSLDGEVGAGRAMAGELAFDANESSYFEFVFEDPFKSGQAIWMVDADKSKN